MNNVHDRNTNIFTVLSLHCSNPRSKPVVDEHTGEIQYVLRQRFSSTSREWIPVRCRRNTCYACAIWNARRIARAICLATPDSVATLTQAGHDYQEIVANMKRFTATVRKSCPDYEHVWMAEPNPQHTGTHVLTYMHTKAATQLEKVVCRAWPYRVDYKRLPPTCSPKYFSYQMKLLADPASALIYLELNGQPPRQRLVHPTHGFWRDGRLGVPMSRDLAERIASDRFFD